MGEKSPISTVTFRYYCGHKLELGTGYLVRTHQGACWAYPNEEDIEKDPHSAGAIALDPRHLEVLPQRPEEPPSYLYRLVLNAPQQEGRIPPSLLASTRAKQTKTLH